MSTAAVPRRIAVIGTSGSGKTTFARAVAAAIGAPHVELDGLFHGPNWTPPDPDDFRARVSQAIAAPAWVTDGNYSGFLKDLIWRQADLIVWLDYPFAVVISRLFFRTMGRSVRQEVLWNGNRESLRSHFLTSESLFLWAYKTHWAHRRDWPPRLAAPELSHVPLVRLRTPRGADIWLADLRRQLAASGDDR